MSNSDDGKDWWVRVWTAERHIQFNLRFDDRASAEAAVEMISESQKDVRLDLTDRDGFRFIINADRILAVALDPRPKNPGGLSGMERIMSSILSPRSGEDEPPPGSQKPN